MKKNVFRFGFIFVGIAMLLAACAPAATPTVPAATQPPQVIVQTKIVAGTPVVQQVVVTATPAPTKATGPFKIAVIMPSAINDQAFSQSMWEGLLAVQKEMGGESKLELAKSENLFNVPDAAAAIRDYASKGYDLVIAHGSQYGTSLAQVAPDFPQTSFAWGTSLDTFQEQGINNIFAYQAEAEQGGYVLGTLAALMSKTGKVGVIGPVEAGDAKLYVDGFKDGAKKTKPSLSVAVTYTGSFSDTAPMANAATTQIQNGADILTGSSQAVVGAIGVARSDNLPWFGTQWTQASLAPKNEVSAQVYDWTPILKQMFTAIRGGTLGGATYTIGLGNGGEVVQYNPGYPLPANVKAKADSLIKAITDGTLTPPQ